METPREVSKKIRDPISNNFVYLKHSPIEERLPIEEMEQPVGFILAY